MSEDGDELGDAFDVLENAETGDDVDAKIESDAPTVGGADVDGTAPHSSSAPVDESPSACRFCRTDFETRTAERRHACRDRVDAGLATRIEDARALIDPAIHEFGANLLFVPPEPILRSGQDGTAPYFAIVSEFDRCLQDGDGSGDDVGTFDAAGSTWELNHDDDKVKYWESAIATRPGDSGDAYYEYQVGLRALDDVGERKANFQFKIAIPDAEHVETGDSIGGIPDDMPEGLRVKADCSNLEPDQILEVLRALLDEMRVDPNYVAPGTMHEWSSVYNCALYARVDRAVSEDKIVGTNGVLERFAQFSSERRGRGEYKWDNEEIMGHRNAVAMNTRSLEKLYGQHTVGKLLKSYHMANPTSEATDDEPTSHPKLEVQFSTEYSDRLEGNSVPWSDADAFDLDELRRELDEFLLHSLTAAGLPLKADPSTYVADAYWSADERVREVALHADRTDDVREHEEDLTRAQLARDDVSSGERDVLRAIADGGRQHYEDLADRSGTSTSTVYRAIDKFDSIVARLGRGKVDLADDVVRDKIRDVFGVLEDVGEWVERGVDAIANGHGTIAEDSPLAKWARSHGAVLHDGRDGLEVELSGRVSEHELRKILRAGFEAARDTGARVAGRFADATVAANVDGERRSGLRAFQQQGGTLRVLGRYDLGLV